MPAFQGNSNVLAAIRRETTAGTAAGTTASLASRMRVIGSGGLDLKRAPIQSQEKTGVGTKAMGRIGGKSVEGDYSAELVVGGATDILLEAIARATMTAARAIPFASMTTLAFGSNTITGAAGDFLATQSLRVGDVFTITGTSLAANNNVNTVIVAIGTLTLTTVSGAFTTLAATATGTLTVQKKVIMGGAAPVEYTHTIEEYDGDTDLSEVFLGCKLTGVKFSFKPNQMATAQYTFLGMDRTIGTTGNSPYFTTPVLTTGLAMIADDSAIRKAGALVTTYTGLDLEFKIAATAVNTLGTFVPTIFANDVEVTGSIMGLRSDFANLTAFDAETEYELGVMLQDPSTTPKGVVGIQLSRIKFFSLHADFGGNDGAKIETLTFSAAVKATTTGYDNAIATLFSSGTTP